MLPSKDIEWQTIKRQETKMRCLPETHFRAKYTHRLKVKGWEEIFHPNRNDKKTEVAILILDKIDFKTESIKKDKDII